MALELTQSNFAQTTAQGVVLIDFWAPWCGPCRALTPIVDQLAKEMAGKAVVAKVNCDTETALAQQFGIRSIPSVFILKDGAVVEQFLGVQSKAVLVKALENALA